MSFDKARRGKRLRRESTNELLVEEVTSDDMGYDGDVEVLRPDNCEEVESDFEDTQPQKRLEWPDPEEELARKLTGLRCDPPSPNSSKPDPADRGTKRESVAMDYEDTRTRSRPHVTKPELEVSELFEGQVEQPPQKRRKKRNSQQTMAHRLIRRQGQGAWSDTTDTERTDGTLRDLLEGGSSRDGTPDVTTTTTTEPSVEDEDAMDIG